MIHVAGAPLTRWNSARSPAHGRAHHWSAPSQPKLCAARRLHGVTPSAPAAPAASTTTAAPSRRSLMIASPLLLLGGWLAGAGHAEDAGITILSETPGIGKHPAASGDLLLFHYVGTLESTGQVFDSTRGGLNYRDGGEGVLRPAAVQLGGSPVPGICQGLRIGLTGMTVGGKRTFTVPSELGFRGATVGAPYALVPGGSSLRYEVELLRLSARGPDELTTGISQCGTGGASESVAACSKIEYAEFV
uniref:peptidylprolyl isomerase n=1 Tax=Chlamydomonas euryale TaxID=1486919 RepID=A0A7R9V545_9CHLO|mmetsp:Transcript_19628/g.58201  ORF Transcript_19628/g.58201 Transcript_19628/m.58201 type:complete len:247 (+) Transcript_19628:42-782(+)